MVNYLFWIFLIICILGTIQVIDGMGLKDSFWFCFFCSMTICLCIDFILEDFGVWEFVSVYVSQLLL